MTTVPHSAGQTDADATRALKIIESMPGFAWSADPDGRFTYISPRTLAYVGGALDDLNTSTDGDEFGWRRMVHPDEYERVVARWRHCLTTGDHYDTEHRLRRADGAYRWMSSRAEPMRDQAGHIVQWYGLCHDIDDQVTAQEALRRASEKLAQATQAASMGELAASIAHEMNQPLGAVVANSHACQRWLTAEPPNVARARRAAERIIGNAHDAANVLSRVRALFKQTAGARIHSRLGSVIGEATQLLAEVALKHGVEIVASMDEDIPPVSFDRVQIQQVLINLMRNGLEAMETSVGARILGVRVHASGGVVRVEVSDDGPGIEHPERTFDSFFTTKEGGMGMGLAISRSIVEAQGGQLWVERNDRGGSTFIFTLPGEPATPSAP